MNYYNERLFCQKDLWFTAVNLNSRKKQESGRNLFVWSDVLKVEGGLALSRRIVQVLSCLVTSFLISYYNSNTAKAEIMIKCWILMAINHQNFKSKPHLAPELINDLPVAASRIYEVNYTCFPGQAILKFVMLNRLNMCLASLSHIC